MQEPVVSPSLLPAILSGISFSLIGIGMRLGTGRGIHVLHLVAVSSAAGLLVFGTRWVVFGHGFPLVVAVLAVISGVTQYVTMHATEAAFRRGSLTAVWCAVMLGFIPVTLYAAAFLGEHLTLWHWGSLAAGVGCVAAAAGLNGTATPAKTRHADSALRYGAALGFVFVLNSVGNVAMKHLAMQPSGDGTNLLEQHGDVFFAGLYLSILVCVAGDQWLTRRPIRQPLPNLGIGLLCGVGSIGGLWLMRYVASMPAAVVFTASTVAGILTAALIAAYAFREPRCRRWYAVLALGLLAVLLAQGPALAVACGR